jgi:hypothetical protein
MRILINFMNIYIVSLSITENRKNLFNLLYNFVKTTQSQCLKKMLDY